MLIHLSNEFFRTNSCTVAQDPYPWNTRINTMHLRETMGYTSQVAKLSSRPWVGNENSHQDIQVSNQDSSKNNLLSSPYQVNAS